jgi:hypothetical protein
VEVPAPVRTTRLGREIRTPNKYSDYVAMVSEVGC